MDDYNTVYLFFQWLRLQAGNNKIYYDIISSSERDYNAVTTAANKYMGGKGYNSWPTLLKTWLAANYINAPSGPYGYMNESVLKSIKAKTAPAAKNIQLFPGEGVFSITNAGFPWPAQGTNIRYAGLTMNSPWLSDSSSYSGGALLTYNANSNTSGARETGITSGVAKVDTLYDRSVDKLPSGPYAVGVRDILRSKGHEEEFVIDLTKLLKTID